jgi:hypothetical protein
MVFIKTNERRAILNGANMPSHHVLEVVRQPAARFLLCRTRNGGYSCAIADPRPPAPQPDGNEGRKAAGIMTRPVGQ